MNYEDWMARNLYADRMFCAGRRAVHDVREWLAGKQVSRETFTALMFAKLGELVG